MGSLRASVTAFAALTFLVWGLLVPPVPGRAEGPSVAAPPYTPRQRLGVGLVTAAEGLDGFPGRLSDYGGLDALGLGWYADWGVRLDPERPHGIEYAQVLSVGPWRSDPVPADYLERIAAVARANPGALWIVGNEPEHPGQGNCRPEEYARIYHRAHTHLKSVDPTAQVAIGGIVFPSPLRLWWLERVLEAYRSEYGVEIPVDVWNTHMQILRENWWEQDYRYDGNCCVGGSWGAGYPVGMNPYDPVVREAALSDLSSCDSADAGLLREFVWEMRRWLVDHGQADKPLIITEYGVLMPNDRLRNGAADVIAFMESTFAFLFTATDPELGYSADGGRLVQRWLWYSLNAPLPECHPDYGCTSEYNGALYDWRAPDTLTPYGEAFARQAALWSIERTRRAWLPIVLR